MQGIKYLLNVVLVLFVAIAAINTAAAAEEKYRYAEKPWGLDSPAGRCVVCHSLEKGGPFRVAPNLWNIVGAEKARDRSWYSYSPALIRNGGTWTEDELNRYLEDAAAFAPGSTKSIRVTDATERQAIIDFLATLKD